MAERTERLVDQKTRFNNLFSTMVFELNELPLADGVDKNSWIHAGCLQDLEKARARILAYIERCLK